MILTEYPPIRRLAEYWLLAFSLTNCYLWIVWNSFLNPALAYFEPSLARLHLGVLIILVLSIPSIVAPAAYFCRRSNWLAAAGRIAFCFAILALRIIVGSIAILLSTILPKQLVPPLSWIVLIVISLTLHRYILQVGIPMLKILSAVGVFLLISGIVIYFMLPSGVQHPEKVMVTNESPVDSHPLILVIIFDEMDGFLVTRDPNESRSLPNLSALRSQSVVMTNAQSPGLATATSIPSLITGARVAESTLMRAPDLDLKFLDNHRGRLSQQSTIFDDARDAGRKVSIVGWYHPYCKLFKVDECFWAEWTSSAGDRPLVGNNVRTVLSDIVYGSLPYLNTELQLRLSRMRDFHAKVLTDVQHNALNQLNSGSCSFVLIHLPMPHPPFLHGNEGHSGGYLGNLAIADQVFGELRSVLEISGRWDPATVIVTSDHTFRKNMWIKARPVWGGRSADEKYSGSTTVPLIIKMPKQHSGTIYDRRLNNVILRKLMGFLFQHPDATASDLTLWLDAKQPEYNFEPLGHLD